MKTVAVFQSEFFNPDAGWDEVAGVQRVPAGKDCAQRLLEELIQRGVAFDHKEPIEAETAWLLHPKRDDHSYAVMVTWAAPVDDSDKNRYWAVFLQHRRGILKQMFLPSAGSQLQELHLMVQGIFADHVQNGVIRDLQWHSEDDF